MKALTSRTRVAIGRTISGHLRRSLRVLAFVGIATLLANCDPAANSERSRPGNDDGTILSLIDARYSYLRCEVLLDRHRALYEVNASDPEDGPLSDGNDDPLTGGHDDPLTGGHDGPLTGGHDEHSVNERSVAIAELADATEKCQKAVDNLDDKFGECLTEFRSCLDAGNPLSCGNAYRECLATKREE